MEKEKFNVKWFRAEVASESEVRKPLLGKSKQVTTYDITQVNLQSFANMLKQAYTSLDADGYDVVNVVPINCGTSRQCSQENGTYVGDAAFSPTLAAMVVGKLKE